MHPTAFLKGLPSPFQGPLKIQDCTFSALSEGLCWLGLFKARFINFGSQEASLTSARCGPACLRQECSMLLAFYASQLTLSTVIILPTPPCKAEKLRLRQRAAARYRCVRASPKIQFNRHRVSERAAPSRERPTPSWPSRSLLVQDASSSGASKSANTETSEEAPLARGVWGVETLNPN